MHGRLFKRLTYTLFPLPPLNPHATFINELKLCYKALTDTRNFNDWNKICTTIKNQNDNIIYNLTNLFISISLVF